jgi:uncharacterized phage protein (TIGR02220 family)
MTPQLYRVANWGSAFESYETKKLTHLKWVPMPNKHDGLGFRKIVAQKNRVELYAAWVLILQVASRGTKEQRGILARDGKPLTSEDLATMTGFPEEIFRKALEFFSSPKMGWLTVDNQQPTVLTADAAGKTAEPQQVAGGKQPEENRREGKGIEGNRIESTASGILLFLNLVAGRSFRETTENLKIISDRLAEVNGDVEGVKKMIERQCQNWIGTEFQQYLRPETLFRKSKFHSYYDDRNQAPFKNAKQNPRNAGIPQDPDKASDIENHIRRQELGESDPFAQ